MNNNIKDNIMSYIIFKPKTEIELIESLNLLKFCYNECITRYGPVKDWDLSNIDPNVYINFFDN